MSPVPPPTQQQVVNGWNPIEIPKEPSLWLPFVNNNAATQLQRRRKCDLTVHMPWLTEWFLAAAHDCFGNHALEGESVRVCCVVCSAGLEQSTQLFFPPSATVQRINSASPPCVSCACVSKHLPARVTVHIPPSKCLCFNVVASTCVCHPRP